MKLKLPDWKDPKIRLKLIFYGGAAVVFLLLSSTIMLATTSSNSFCNLFCHSMDNDVNAFHRSAHANVTCMSCHGPGELPELLLEKAMAGKEMLAEFITGYEKPINGESHLAKEFPSEHCERCHAIDIRDVTPSSGLMINHKKHEEKGVNCTYCHNRVAHPKLAGYENYLTMEGCYRGGGPEGEGEGEAEAQTESEAEARGCHSLAAGAKAPGKCEACHTKEFTLKPKNHLAADFLPPKHAKMAKGDREYCNMCHISNFCQNCHGPGVEMPHPAKFIKKDHGTVGNQNPAICQRCHLQQQFCTACHHKGFDETKGPFGRPEPGRPAQHPLLVKAKGAEACFKCHGPTYCAHCHVTGQKSASIKGP